MSKSIAQLLRHFRELDGEPDSEAILLRLDIERALLHVDFTDEEADTVRALFLVDPDHPSHHSRVGRPRGGTTRDYIASLMRDSQKSENAMNIRVSRALKNACTKLADFLGEEYQ